MIEESKFGLIFFLFLNTLKHVTNEKVIAGLQEKAFLTMGLRTNRYLNIPDQVEAVCCWGICENDKRPQNQASVCNYPVDLSALLYRSPILGQ